ncbi:serpin B9-like [Paramacrobiotus metropolitanus]|uniref:serpin B9-like n=1 Tax=Paramacrobiotus metropolitanus TaxID=2943436 RepID=UPI00244605EC|nr:serpin B9-like [Paramacrobiotus metropolitanus]
MEKFLGLIKSCLGRAPSHPPQRTLRKCKASATDFTDMPHSCWADSMFRDVVGGVWTANPLDANIVVSPFAVDILWKGLFPEYPVSLNTRPFPPVSVYSFSVKYPEMIQPIADMVGALNSITTALFPDYASLLAPHYEKTPELAENCRFIGGIVERFPEKPPATTDQNVEGKITMLLTHYKREAQLIMVNIADFSGQWEFPFDEAETKTGTFHGLANVEKTVAFMTNKNLICRQVNIYNKRLKTNVAQMIILHMAEKKFCVMLILPANSNEGINDFERELTVGKLLAWRQKSKEDLAHVVLPKFRICCDVELRPFDSEMNMDKRLALATADRITVSRENGQFAAVSQFRQQVAVEMNEFGINAAPAAYCSKEFNTGDSKPDFLANRPFLLIIWNEMVNVPVFMGRITEPC